MKSFHNASMNNVRKVMITDCQEMLSNDNLDQVTYRKIDGYRMCTRPEKPSIDNFHFLQCSITNAMYETTVMYIMKLITFVKTTSFLHLSSIRMSPLYMFIGARIIKMWMSKSKTFRKIIEA